MKTIRRISAVCLLGVLSASIASCGQNSDSSTTAKLSDNAEYREEVYAMDTHMELKAYGTNNKKAVKAAISEIKSIDKELSVTNVESEISQLNKNGTYTFTKDAAYLLKHALSLYQSTKGQFDVTSYIATKTWGFTTGKYKVPSVSKIASIKKLIGSDQLIYNEKTGKVSFKKKGMMLDFGAIAKGYTSQRCMEIFKENGIKSAVVNLGGNVQVLGQKPDGSNWNVAVMSPDKKSYIGVVQTHDMAIITSGGYERYFKQAGKTYIHIMNPKTASPAESGLASVTIVSKDGTVSDGLSTSLFVMGKEKAVSYWRKHKSEFDAILLTKDGKLYVTEGIANIFKTTDNNKVEKVTA